MLFGTIILNSTTYRISESGYADIYYYDPYIISFAPPNYNTRSVYGGYCELSFGSISLSPDLFVNEWPPPINAELVLKYTDTTEAAASTLISGTIHLSEGAITKDTVEYDTFGKSYTTNLLAETTDYDGNTNVPLPRAFGSINHQIPIRIADAGGKPTYHKVYISGTLAKTFSAVANNGSGKCRFTCNAHGFSTGNNVVIEGANRVYNGTYSITNINANTFDITTLTYSVNTSGHAYKDTYWRVYDDGVPISANVTDNGDGTFSLSATPVGEVTISGDGEDTTLSEVFDWACGASYLNLTYNTTKARVSSPSLGYWASSQMLLIDFLSEISAFFTHLFYINNSTLYLVDMLLDNGSRTITEFDYFTSTYSYQCPVKSIGSDWVTRMDVEETIGKYIKDKNNDTLKESAYVYGNPLSVTPYQNNRSDIDSALTNILTIIHKAGADIEVPLQGYLPVPGEKISWIDTSLRISTDIYIRCRSIRYDSLNDSVYITGEGEISAT